MNKWLSFRISTFIASSRVIVNVYDDLTSQGFRRTNEKRLVYRFDVGWFQSSSDSLLVTASILRNNFPIEQRFSIRLFALSDTRFVANILLKKLIDASILRAKSATNSTVSAISSAHAPLRRRLSLAVIKLTDYLGSGRIVSDKWKEGKRKDTVGQLCRRLGSPISRALLSLLVFPRSNLDRTVHNDDHNESLVDVRRELYRPGEWAASENRESKPVWDRSTEKRRREVLRSLVVVSVEMERLRVSTDRIQNWYSFRGWATWLSLSLSLSSCSVRSLEKIAERTAREGRINMRRRAARRSRAFRIGDSSDAFFLRATTAATNSAKTRLVTTSDNTIATARRSSYAVINRRSPGRSSCSPLYTRSLRTRSAPLDARPAREIMDCHDATDNGLKELAVSRDISTNRLLSDDFCDSISWIYIFRVENRRIFFSICCLWEIFSGIDSIISTI